MRVNITSVTTEPPEMVVTVPHTGDTYKLRLANFDEALAFARRFRVAKRFDRRGAKAAAA